MNKLTNSAHKTEGVNRIKKRVVLFLRFQRGRKKTMNQASTITALVTTGARF